MKRLFLAIALLAPLLSGCGGFEEWERAACAPAKPHDPGVAEITLPSGGIERRALLFVPGEYDGTEEYPLVFSWHGYASNAENHLAYADFRPTAEDGRFFVVVPQGVGDPTRFNLGAGITGDTDDVQLALDLIDRVGTDLCLDHTRVYSSGVSNGAGMSAVLACRAPGTFAAIGMDALLLHPEPCDGPTPAVVGMMGDADLVVPFQGGRVNCCGGWPIAPAGHTMDAWAAQLHCDGYDDDSVSKHVDRRTWHGCDDGRQVVYYIVHGGGHTWPGAPDNNPLGPTNQEIDASEVMWNFFRRYSL